MDRTTYPVFEQTRHEPTAELLTKTDDAVPGARVDLEVEPLGDLQVLVERVAFVLGVGLENLPQDGIEDEGPDGGDVVVTDVLHDPAGICEERRLERLVCGGRGDGPQLFEDV